MASFLGQEEVEQCAVAAVHAAVLFLIREDLATGMHAANELVGPSSTFRAHQHEWMQVLHVPHMHDFQLCVPGPFLCLASSM